MADLKTLAVNELVLANKILLHNQVLDVFGHVSVRHPEFPERYLLSSALPPSLVTTDDILEFNLDASPVDAANKSLYIERFIHGSIYQARPEVNAICHHHAKAIMPFCVVSTPLQAVSQTGASMGANIPVWDSRDEFGDTNLLVSTQEQADSLTKTLADSWLVIMRRHGACSLGNSLRELVFRAVFACRDAEILLSALSLGEIDPLNSRELKLTEQISNKAITRAWDHWLTLLQVNSSS
ncbi:MAG: ribulose-5-phosphate 4-epimerase/fuculose-1-phosphate aldolase [Gammaproteobacteria bacterium]|jgi:ribulose-5-phosphate 4-epimerase/fuculose-1-phosphate aldolase